ncbi:type II secretion system minor pseudopilin GspH [Rhodothalassium salexigens]|uniref:type II secretion system minor pseudopilin GspH n=1 Tax=Rhodothalassium salexigens TaxID=1086 RepID=UPI001911F180|nr:type II secretion system minor pseudopilin GspH [Rhodothalassium salexigens]
MAGPGPTGLTPAGPGGARRDHAAGFSLVEFMIVLVILGLVSGAVALTLPPGRASLADEAGRLVARLSRAGDEAVISGAALGVRVDAHGYGFWRRRQGQWLAFTGEGLFAPQAWHAGTQADLVEAGGWFALDIVADADPRATPPAIRFYPDGTATAFTLRLSRRSQDLVIEGDPAGAIRVADGQEPGR